MSRPINLTKKPPIFDAIIIGGGAAGTFCAIHAAKLGVKVAIIEQNHHIGNKIRISGGGRCNVTNLYIEAEAYLSNNPDFCRSALARYSQWDFLSWFTDAGLTYQEKKLGQLFCMQKSRGLIAALNQQCDDYGVTIITDTHISEVNQNALTSPYCLNTKQGQFMGRSLVIACGGPSFVKLGGSDFALKLAKQFHLRNIPFRPALVPLTLSEPMRNLSGVSTEVIVSCTESPRFRENILFTHRGLSGPAILQISSYWRKGQTIMLNFLPNASADFLLDRKHHQPKQMLYQALKEHLPQAVINALLSDYPNKPLQHYSDAILKKLMMQLQQWPIIPSGTEGMNKAEVSTGGIDTREFNPRTFAATKNPNLYAIGEALDVTGWLGGYNFQWAWSSAWCCAQALALNIS